MSVTVGIQDDKTSISSSQNELETIANAEIELIETAQLISDGLDRPLSRESKDPQDKESIVDENDIIAKAVLARSETEKAETITVDTTRDVIAHDTEQQAADNLCDQKINNDSEVTETEDTGVTAKLETDESTLPRRNSDQADVKTDKSEDTTAEQSQKSAMVEEENVIEDIKQHLEQAKPHINNEEGHIYVNKDLVTSISNRKSPDVFEDPTCGSPSEIKTEDYPKPSTLKTDDTQEYSLVPPLDFGSLPESNELQDGYITPANSLVTENAERRNSNDSQIEASRLPLDMVSIEALKSDITQPLERQDNTYEAKGNDDKKVDTTNAMEDTVTDVDFNNFIVDVANEISAAELDMVKSTVRDSMKHLSDPSLLDIDQSLVFLNQLRRYRLISRDNLYHLQMILMKINKPQLYEKAIQYIKHNYQVVYFYPPTDMIPDGYDTIKCHIAGKDFTRLKRADLEQLRTVMAMQLFIPSYLVYIVGIEPGLSMVLTLMVPKVYMSNIRQMVTDGFPELVALDIDAIQVNGKTFILKEVETDSQFANDHLKFLTVFQQLRQKNVSLQDRDIEIDRLNNEAGLMKLELDTMSAELEILTQRALTSHLQRQPINVRPRDRKHWRTTSLPEGMNTSVSPERTPKARPVSFTTADDVFERRFSIEDDPYDIAKEFKQMEEAYIRGIHIDEMKLVSGSNTLMVEIEQLLNELGSS